MEHIIIHTTIGEISFVGKYRRDLETKHWHYYEKENGRILHFHKSQLISVESDVVKSTYASKTEPPPIPGGKPVLPAVIDDLRERSEYGKKKHGTILKTFNERRGLVDAYQEALDLVMYLKKELMEQEEVEK